MFWEREILVDVGRLNTFRTVQPISGFAFLAPRPGIGREAGACVAVRSRAGALERVPQFLQPSAASFQNLKDF